MPTHHVRPSGPHAAPVAIALAAVSALAAASVASAMPQDVATPPQPDRSMNLISAVGGYALMAIMAAGVVLVNLMPSKRGHQD
jgi:hypothetical protein